MTSFSRFVADELVTLAAPADEVLARSGMERPLVASAVGAPGTPAAVPLGQQAALLRRWVRVRRLTAAFYVLFTVALPAAPLLIGVGRSIAGHGDGLGAALVDGAIAYVPLAIAGLFIASKLAPAFFKLIGVDATR